MTALLTLNEQWQALAEEIARAGMGWLPASLRPVKVSQQQRILSRDELAPLFAQIEQAEGWLLLTGEVVQLPATIDPSSSVLQAEACIEGKTWQLRYLGGSRWCCQEFTFDYCDADEATHLAESVTHMLATGTPGCLCYQALWHISPDAAPRVQAAIFTGFEVQRT
jgi:hypothetical protein